MKKIMLSIFACGCFYLAPAQVNTRPDSSRAMRTPNTYGTDSVRNGQETYQGGKGRKSKSQGDTLAKPRQGQGNTPRQSNNDMRQEHGTQGAAPTATPGNTPKHPK